MGLTDEQLKDELKEKENALKQNLTDAVKLRKQISGLMTTLGIRKYPNYNKIKSKKLRENE